MRDYDLVGCGHCGRGVVPHLASLCPFRQEPVCDACYAEAIRFVNDLQAQGHDPLPQPQRRPRSRQSTPRRPLR